MRSTETSSNMQRLKSAAQACGDLAHLVPDETSDRLLVIFSHVDIPVGKFAQSRAVADLPGTKLFLNCRDNGWYCKGIGSFASDMTSLVSKLLDMTEAFDTLFIGHSMGAYTSLICGQHSDKARFVSTSPELSLGLEFSRSWRNNVNATPELAGLALYKAKMTRDAEGIIAFGAYDPVDCYFLANLGELEHTPCVYEVPHHHGVTEYFTGNRVYLDLLNSQIDAPENLNTLKVKGHLSAPYTYGTKAQYNHFYETFRQFHRASADRSLRASVSILHADWENPGWQELRAKVWMSLGETTFALEAAERAYQFQPDLMQFINTYGNICLRLGERQRLGALLDAMTMAQKNHAVGKRLIERTHANFGKLFRAQPAAHVGERYTAIRMSQRLETKPAPTGEHGLIHVDTLNAAFLAKEYTRVLEMTAPDILRRARPDARVLRARLLSLLEIGNRSLALRELRTALAYTNNHNLLARACLTAAIKLQSSEFVMRYLGLQMEDKVRAANIGSLQQTLHFVTDPYLVAHIIVELVHYSRHLERSLQIVAAKLKPVGTTYAAARLIPGMLRSETLSEEARRSVTTFLINSGLRASAYAWLYGQSYQEASPTSPNTLLPDLEACLPTKEDYVQAPHEDVPRENA